MMRALLALSLLGALTACSLVPDYERPALPAKTDWREPVPAEAGGADPGAWPETDWWTAFGSPALDRLIAQARANNQDLAAAAARVLQADAQARVAGAPLLPSVGGSSDVGRQWSWSTATTPTTDTSLSAGFNASYELDLFGRNRAQLLSAEESALRSRYDRATVALTVTAETASTYFQVLQAATRLRVARDNLAIAEQVLEVVEAREAAGAASPLELAQQRNAVASQRATIPPLETQLRQAETALAILLGEAPRSLEGLGEQLMAVTPPTPQPGLPSMLLARRPDLQSAEAQLRAANAEIGAARAAFFPQVSLTGSNGIDTPLVATLFDPVRTSLSLAAGLTQTIFSGGQLEGQLELAEARKQELVAAYRQAVITAFGDVENALIALRKAEEREVLQRVAQEQARLAYELAEARYRAGAEDLLTVLDAQRSLFSAEDAVVQSRFQRLDAAVDLYRALGGGWSAEAGTT